MCDNCNQYGLAALEALANGEEIPERQEVEAVEVVNLCLPFPVMITITDNGVVGIITNREGGDAIRNYLQSIGHPPGQCGHDHH